MRNNASLAYGFLLVVGDFLALVAAFAAAYGLRIKLDSRPVYVTGFTAEDYIMTLLFLIPFFLVVFGLLGLYNKTVYENRFSEFGRLGVGSFVGILFLISYGYITETDVFPTRLITLYALVSAFLFVLLFRTIARAVRRSLFSFGVGVSNVLIVGDTPITREFIAALSNTRTSGYRVVGIVGEKNMGSQYSHYKSFSTAIRALEKVGVQSIIQTELYSSPEKNAEILSFAQENHVAFRFVPGNEELFAGNIDVDLFGGIPVVAVHQTAIVGWGRIVKRLFDAVVGTLALIVALPVMLIVGLLILLFDFGPIFFRQERLSRFNSKVRIFKFRTLKVKWSGMTPEEAFERMGKPDLAKQYRKNGDFLDSDPRISLIGRFLRATSLDELPQLINVVRGDISLVGPRALIPQELDEYEKKNLILYVKSGMTGLAVISGRRDIPFEERRQLDLYYVQNWSFWNDIVILAKTAAMVVLRRGAK